MAEIVQVIYHDGKEYDMTPAALLIILSFYADFTGRPAYTLLADNWGQRHDLGYRWQQHQVQYGDLNLDDVVDQQDAEIYNSVMPPFGWTVGGKVHWFRDCSYIKDKPVRACLIGDNLCLRCLSRKVNQ